MIQKLLVISQSFIQYGSSCKVFIIISTLRLCTGGKVTVLPCPSLKRKLIKTYIMHHGLPLSCQNKPTRSKRCWNITDLTPNTQRTGIHSNTPVHFTRFELNIVSGIWNSTAVLIMISSTFQHFSRIPYLTIVFKYLLGYKDAWIPKVTESHYQRHLILRNNQCNSSYIWE